jgi:glucose/mannose-6-phosphate isomerase
MASDGVTDLTGGDILDDAEKIRKVDPSDMLGVLSSMPGQVRDAYSLPRPKLRIPRPASIVVLGMGGSAIGGDLLGACLLEKGGPQVIVNRDYDIPAFVDKNSVVFAVSYSGNTEETLSGFAQAKKRGCRIVTISSGGKLNELGEAAMHIALPKGLQPRAAVAWMLVPMLGVLEDMGVADVRTDVEEAAGMLEGMMKELAPSVPASKNLSKEVAAELHGTFPMIFSGPLMAPVAKRWRTQLNENSKMLAREDILPEMDHNDLVAWSEDPMAAHCAVILLRDDAEHPRVAMRMELTRKLGLDRARSVREVRSRGKGTLARLLSTMAVGDFSSVYLAILRGVDPTPVRVIEKLKIELVG